MYSIAVCDDEKETAVYIAAEIEKQFAQEGHKADAEWYTTPEALEKAIASQVHYDALLLDIDMPGVDGIELCRRIRKSDRDIIIVFISNREELVFQTFEVSPFRFIRKSYFNNEAGALCRDLTTEFDRRESYFLRFENRREGTIYSVNIRRLMYVEAQRKFCVLYSMDEENHKQMEEIRISFSDLMDKMKDFRFIQIHRSYLVNPAYIYQMQKETVILTDKTELPLSRYKEESARNAFFDWCAEQ